jgi:hypothetical protein
VLRTLTPLLAALDAADRTSAGAIVAPIRQFDEKRRQRVALLSELLHVVAARGAANG